MPSEVEDARERNTRGDWLLVAKDWHAGGTLTCSDCESKRLALVASESFKDYMGEDKVDLPDNWSDNQNNYTLCYDCYGTRFGVENLTQIEKRFKDSRLGWAKPTEQQLEEQKEKVADFAKEAVVGLESDCGECNRAFYKLFRAEDVGLKYDVCLNCLKKLVSKQRFQRLNKDIPNKDRRFLAIPIHNIPDAHAEWLGTGKQNDLNLVRISHTTEKHEPKIGFCDICNAKVMETKDIEKEEIDEEKGSRILVEFILQPLLNPKLHENFLDMIQRIELDRSEGKALSDLMKYAKTIVEKYSTDGELTRYYIQEEAKKMIRDNPNIVKKLKVYTSFEDHGLFTGEIVDEFDRCPLCKGNQDMIVEGSTLEEVKKNTGDHIVEHHPKYQKLLEQQGQNIYDLDINFQPPNQELDDWYNKVGSRIPEEGIGEYKKFLNKVHYMKIPSEKKMVMVGDFGLKLIHTHEKHAVDRFDWCDKCNCLFINGEPRKPTIPIEARREMSDCKICLDHFSNVSQTVIEEIKQLNKIGKAFESDFLNRWTQHLADEHPVILKHIQKNGWQLNFKDEDGNQVRLKIKKPAKPVKVWRNYYQAVSFLKKFNLTSKAEYKVFCKTNECPDDIPPRPDKVYPEFKDWATYLSSKIYDYRKDTKAFTPERLEEFRQEFVKNWGLYSTWTDGMITDTLRSLGLFNHKDPRVRQLATKFMDMWHDPATKQTLFEHISKTRFDMQKGHFILPVKTDATGNTKYLKRKYTKTTKQKKHGLMYEEEAKSVQELISSTRGVKALIPDSRYMKLIVDFTVKMIWKRVFDPRNIQELTAIQNEKMNGNEFHDKVLVKFQDEYDQVKGLKIGDDYIFHHKPNLMQLYTAYKLKMMNGFFNMCRTGTGKTNAGIMATRATNSKFTLILTPNSIIDQWEDAINSCYKSQVVTSGINLFDDYWSRTRFNYHIMNYDKLSHNNPAKKVMQQIKKLVKKANHKIDFVIVDEAQNVKVRNEEISKRRENLDKILKDLRKINPKLKVLALSATPVINNVREGKSLLEMITGENYTFLKTRMDVESATSLHTEFQPFTIRYVEKYDIEQHEHYYDVVSTIPTIFKNEQIRKFHWRDHEEIMVDAKIPKMIDVIKKTNGKVIVYTEFVEGIVDKIEEALINEHVTYGKFTGEEKSGMQEKVVRGGKKEIVNKFVDGDIKVLIASMPIAEGVDRLQYVCNNIIFIGIPWTYARLEQIVGRLVRTGQLQRDVHVHIIKAVYNGFNYDQRMKLNRLSVKKALGNCVVDGTIPNFSELDLKNRDRKHFYETILKNQTRRLKKEFLQK